MKIVVKRIVTGAILGFFFWSAFLLLPPTLFSVILLAILVQIICVEWRNFFDFYQPTFWLLMPLYPILPFMLLIIMNHTPAYRHLLFILFIIVSSLDTASYFIGSVFGKHKIYPLISPAKTWEGFFGGYIAACISFSILLWEQGGLKQPMWVVLLFTLVVCLLALCGDLFESFLKRRARIKDSGTILPGHGGFLDRFDGILFAAVFFFVFRSYLARLF